jgi:hypothetical protein
LCHTNEKTSIESANEWYLLQAYQKYVPSNDIILVNFLLDPNVKILNFFPRIQTTGKELPRVLFINGMEHIQKYEGKHYTKYFIEWIKETLLHLDTNNTTEKQEQIQEVETEEIVISDI